MTYWLNKDSRTFLSRGYLKEGQTPEERIDQIATAVAREHDRPDLYERVMDVINRGWISLSSPIWTNFGNERGLPISCNGSYFEDSVESIVSKTAEISMQTKYGAGTSAYMSHLRPSGSPISVGGFADGPVHYMELVQAGVNIISQSNIRRGNCGVYIDIDHPDFDDFIGALEEGHPIQHLSLGLCISDAWMQSMLDGDKKKQKKWARVLKKRFETGYPYIFWSDAANRGAPPEYTSLGYTIWASNLCTEIMLASSADESFVCCLLSMNLLHYEEWKDTDAVETAVYILDAVMSEYIRKVADIPHMKTVYNFASRQRAIGVGVLGWHSLLQSKNVAFESMEAKMLNVEIFQNLQRTTMAASQKLAAEFGEPEALNGSGRRHMTLMAIAPTTSSSFILGQVSPGIEPLDSNFFQSDVQKGTFTYRNPYLRALLIEKGQDTADVWRSILERAGSVQHLEFLSDHERAVFKTFGEISQWEIIIQAQARQKYIDQGQSINLKIHPAASPKDVSELMIEAWRLGIKSLYYQRSTSKSQELVRDLTRCVSCEA